jgi:uncharacterized membrane protein YhdT
MSDKNAFPEMRERNPVTRAKHKKQIFWQIQLPIIVVCVLVLIAIIVVLLASATQIATWANISIFYMGLMFLVVALVLIAITIIGSYYLYRANRQLPFLTFQGQRFLFILENRTHRISDKIARPFVRFHGLVASGGAIFRGKRDTKTPSDR